MKLMNNNFIESLTFKLRTVHDHFTKRFYKSLETNKIEEMLIVNKGQKTTEKEFQQIRIRRKFICFEHFRTQVVFLE